MAIGVRSPEVLGLPNKLGSHQVRGADRDGDPEWSGPGRRTEAGGSLTLELVGDHADRVVEDEQVGLDGAGEAAPGVLAVDEPDVAARRQRVRSEEHTSELQSLMRNSYAVFCLKKKTSTNTTQSIQMTSGKL